MERRFTGLVLAGTGTALLVLLIGSATDDVASAILGTGTFALIAAALVFVGAWISWTDDPIGAYAERIPIWTFGVATTFAAVGILIVLGTEQFRLVFGFPRAALQAFTAGSLAGSLLGVYDARSRYRQAELESQRDFAERFAYKAKSLNAYGKALNESRDIHDISALSVEVLELLIESSESAVVAVFEDSTSILDTTLPDDCHDWVEQVSTIFADQPSTETVRCPENIECQIPEEVAVSEVIGVPIETDELTLVLLATPSSSEAYSEEDIDLLESLSAHLATALPNLDRNRPENMV